MSIMYPKHHHQSF